jgi:hypothetical protein
VVVDAAPGLAAQGLIVLTTKPAAGTPDYRAGGEDLAAVLDAAGRLTALKSDFAEGEGI